MTKNKTRKQIAQEYGVSRRTFYRMLKRADLTLPPGMITPEFQKKIYNHFGKPAARQATDE